MSTATDVRARLLFRQDYLGDVPEVPAVKFRAASSHANKSLGTIERRIKILGVATFEKGQKTDSYHDEHAFREYIESESIDVRWFDEPIQP